MLKVNSEMFYERLCRLVDAVWRDGKVPQDWVNAEIVPIPKKGDLSVCDNWRGIALLDVVGKLFGRIILARLQTVAEHELPESQCGFRPGRGCTDMIFVIHQVIEKCIEHRIKGFLIFVDLRKAYDSVPRPALWAVLRKLGVPDILVRLVESFHDNMSADIIVDSSSVDGIPVCNGLRQGCTMAPVLFNLFNGLRQGCTMAPVLFNLFAAAVMERWHARLQILGVSGFPFNHCIDGQLFKRSKRDIESCITDGEFADDAVLLA